MDRPPVRLGNAALGSLKCLSPSWDGDKITTEENKRFSNADRRRAAQCQQSSFGQRNFGTKGGSWLEPTVGRGRGRLKGPWWVICITGGATQILLEELRPVLSSSALLITLQPSAPGRGAAPSSERARKTASKRWKPGLPAGWLCGPCRRKPTATGC